MIRNKHQNLVLPIIYHLSPREHEQDNDLFQSLTLGDDVVLTGSGVETVCPKPNPNAEGTESSKADWNQPSIFKAFDPK